MADTTAPIAQEPSNAAAPATVPASETAPDATPARRTVTLPVLPLAIIGAVVIALIFFGGGIAVGFAIGDHPTRVGVIQPFPGRNGVQGGQNGYGRNGSQGNGNGFGKNGGQGGQGNGTRPNTGPTTAPNNG